MASESGKHKGRTQMSGDETSEGPIHQRAGLHFAPAMTVALVFIFTCVMSSLYRAF
jgi:hypothetical protein